MKNFLDTVNPQNYFVLKNGFLVRSLPELASVIRDIDGEIFYHHVNSEKNDFINWIDHVVGDDFLKNNLKGIDTQEQFLRILNSRIYQLQTNQSDIKDGFIPDQDVQFDIPNEEDILRSIVGDETMSNMSMAEAQTVQKEKPMSQPEDSPEEVTDELPTELPPDLPPDMPPELPDEKETNEDHAEETPETNEQEKQAEEELKQEDKPEKQQETKINEKSSENNIEDQKSEDKQDLKKAEQPNQEEQEKVEEKPEQSKAEEPQDKTEEITKEEKERVAEKTEQENKESDEEQPEQPEQQEEQVPEEKVEIDKKGQPEEEPEEEQVNQEEDLVELREIELMSLGLKEIDNLFPKGIPKICNMMFMGTMSTGKTLTALNLILERAKLGEKALYISFHDSEEKIINVMKSLDPKILDYVNSGNIMIKKLNPFQIVDDFTKKANKNFEKCCKYLEFVQVFGPQLVVVDSLSALELTFGQNKIDYRHYVDRMYKYFERLGLLGVFIQELKSDSEINKEFFENLLSDIIIYFSRNENSKKSDLKVIKEYPIPESAKKANPKKQKRGLFGLLKKKKKKD